MQSRVEKTISEQEIKEIVQNLASKITKDYQGKNPVLIGILKGANVFVSDLMRELDFMLEVDYMVVSSYGKSTTTSGVVRILKDLTTEITDRDVIIIEDLIDTGLTLSYLKANLLSRNPKSVKICTLLNKPSRRKVDVQVDYIGKDIEDYFVVGYGIDLLNNTEIYLMLQDTKRN